MKHDAPSRASSEKVAWEAGDVHEKSARLHSRFSHVFLGPNAVFNENQLATIVTDATRDRFLLDYGCFDGWSIPTLLKCAPRRIFGIDIAENAIVTARREYGHIADFSVMDCHRLALRNESIDVVVGRAILHHLDFDVAMREVHRVLKRGGKAIFLEPLRDNPAGKLVRLLTPGARTKDELPLTRSQIQRADKMFGENRHFFSGFMSVGCGMLSSLISKDPANAVMRLAHRVDLRLADSPLKWWMRMVLLCWTK